MPPHLTIGPYDWGKNLARRDALNRKKGQLQLEVERTLRRVGYELSRLGREAASLNARRPDENLYIASDSAVWRLMGTELPDLRNRLSRVIAKIECISYLQALAKVHAWQRPLVRRLVCPSLRTLEGVEVRMMESESATVDAYGPEDN